VSLLADPKFLTALTSILGQGDGLRSLAGSRQAPADCSVTYRSERSAQIGGIVDVSSQDRVGIAVGSGLVGRSPGWAPPARFAQAQRPAGSMLAWPIRAWLMWSPCPGDSSMSAGHSHQAHS
jgi:hypothetical protein